MTQSANLPACGVCGTTEGVTPMVANIPGLAVSIRWCGTCLLRVHNDPEFLVELIRRFGGKSGN